MTLDLFIAILVMSATATSIAVQIVKNILDKFNIDYNSIPIAVVLSVIVGISEVFIYYALNGLPIVSTTILYAVCMGFANALGATSSYDLVKKFIYALAGK